MSYLPCSACENSELRVMMFRTTFQISVHVAKCVLYRLLVNAVFITNTFL
jgi:hypothetical protein